jgi:hypothetical protein
MNQRADSRKKNLRIMRAKSLIDQRRWLLSHTMRCTRAKKRIAYTFVAGLKQISAPLDKFILLYLSVHRRRLLFEWGSRMNKTSPEARELPVKKARADRANEQIQCGAHSRT